MVVRVASPAPLKAPAIQTTIDIAITRVDIDIATLATATERWKLSCSRTRNGAIAAEDDTVSAEAGDDTSVETLGMTISMTVQAFEVAGDVPDATTRTTTKPPSWPSILGT